jgi:hypothetical protein
VAQAAEWAARALADPAVAVAVAQADRAVEAAAEPPADRADQARVDRRADRRADPAEWAEAQVDQVDRAAARVDPVVRVDLAVLADPVALEAPADRVAVDQADHARFRARA